MQKRPNMVLNFATWCGNISYAFEKISAEVVELADALDSGSSARKGVQVRILSSAPIMKATRKADFKALRFLFLSAW